MPWSSWAAIATAPTSDPELDFLGDEEINETTVSSDLSVADSAVAVETIFSGTMMFFQGRNVRLWAAARFGLAICNLIKNP